MDEREYGAPPEVDLDQAYKVLVGLSLAFAGGVALFAVVSVFLVQTGSFTPFMGYTGLVRGAVAAFVILLIGSSWPLYRLAGGAVSADDPNAALSAFQIKVIVANAIREAAGLMGGVLILLFGDLLVGGTAAALSVGAILLSLPRKDDMREALRRRN